MIWLFLALPLIAASDVSQRCRDFGEQIDRGLAEQKQLELKKKELEESLKAALQQEITAQVEKRNNQEETGAATAIYYELRKSRMESERWTKVMAALRTGHCEVCEKQGGWSKGSSELCRRCPQAKSCLGKGVQ